MPPQMEALVRQNHLHGVLVQPVGQVDFRAKYAEEEGGAHAFGLVHARLQQRRRPQAEPQPQRAEQRVAQQQGNAGQPDDGADIHPDLHGVDAGGG